MCIYAMYLDHVYGLVVSELSTTTNEESPRSLYALETEDILPSGCLVLFALLSMPHAYRTKSL